METQDDYLTISFRTSYWLGWNVMIRICFCLILGFFLMGLPRFHQYGIEVALLVCFAVALFLFLLYPTFDNFYVKRLASKNMDPGMPCDFAVICSIIVEPLKGSGSIAYISYSDDIGWLRFEATRLCYEGDSTCFSVAYEHIAFLSESNNPLISPIYNRKIGTCLHLNLPQPRGTMVLWIREGQSYTAGGSRKIRKKIDQQLKWRIEHFTKEHAEKGALNPSDDSAD